MIIENNMHLEVQIGLNFILSYLYNKLPRRRVNMFGEELEKHMKLKFQGHWHTDKMYRESGYRCLKLNSENIDLVFVKAAHDSGMELQEVLKNLPQYFVLWIDPSEVSYRLIDKGPVKILYEDEIRAKFRQKKLELKKENLIQNKGLTYRAHHHHHCQNSIANFYANNGSNNEDYDFLIEDDDTFYDIAIDNEECLCYYDFEFTYDNDTNTNLSTNSLNSTMVPSVSTPSLLSSAFSTNDLQQLQQLQQLQLQQNNNSHQQLTATASEPVQNQFNPDAESFKPSLMNSHSSTSLANSKAYKGNIFSSTNNLSKGFTPNSTNLPSLSSNFYNQSQSPFQLPNSQQQQQQSQSQQQQQQQQIRNNVQRLLNTSIDSLNSPFNSLSLSSPSPFTPLQNTTTNNHTSLWSLPSISSPIGASNSNLLLSTTGNTNGNLPSSELGTPTGNVNALLNNSLGSPSLNNLNVASTLASVKSSTTNANQQFTTAAFAQTKFGSTKSKNSNRRPQKMLPSEFSAYIKQKAQIQQLTKSPQINKTPFGLTSSPQQNYLNANTPTGATNGIIGSNHIPASISPGLTGASQLDDANLILERSYSNNPLNNAVSPPLRSISISNPMNASDLFNFDANNFDTGNHNTLASSILSPHIKQNQQQQQQHQQLGNCLNEFTLLNNNKLNYLSNGCMSSNSSDSSSVGSSFLGDSISPPSPLQLSTSGGAALSATTSTATIATAVTRKNSFGNFKPTTTTTTTNNRLLNNTNFYSTNQNSNVSTNSLVAGFANIAATQQFQTNNSNNNKNSDILSNFPYLRSNSMSNAIVSPSSPLFNGGNTLLNNNKNKFEIPSRPNSLLLHLQYEKELSESKNFNDDETNYVDDDVLIDDMPQYFNQYDNIVECELEPENINANNVSNDDEYIYGNFNNFNVNDDKALNLAKISSLASSLSSSSSSLNNFSQNKTNSSINTSSTATASNIVESTVATTNTTATTTPTTTNSFQNQLLMAN